MIPGDSNDSSSDSQRFWRFAAIPPGFQAGIEDYVILGNNEGNIIFL